MENFKDKYGKFLNAIVRLEKAINVYEQNPNAVVRDGTIFRFKSCTELAWKTTREYLIDQGYVDINSPKSVMKQAYADGLLENEGAWLELLNARNLTAHIYDDATASKIFDDIKNSYLLQFEKLLMKLK